MDFWKQLYKSALGDDRYRRTRFERQFAQDQSRRTPILLVHQMGKVGSTSIGHSLEAFGLDNEWRIYQTHFLTPDGMAFLESLDLQRYGDKSNFPPRIKRRRQLARSISEHWYAGDFAEQQVKVITLVRDPVATNLSGFFNQLFIMWPEELRQKCQLRDAGWQDELLDYFLDNYPHDIPATWFDFELNPLFDVDVSQLGFDRSQGYQVYDAKEPHVLLLRLESMGSESIKAIREFVDLSDLEILRTNAAEDKWYAELYAEFKESLILPSSYLDRLYDTDHARLFYSPEEIEGFRMKWQMIKVRE